MYVGLHKKITIKIKEFPSFYFLKYALIKLFLFHQLSDQKTINYLSYFSYNKIKTMGFILNQIDKVFLNLFIKRILIELILIFFKINL